MDADIMKKILIAGTASGVGKTTITLAIEAALIRRGIAVQPFKCGPDYLDTAHHTAICGRQCRNLDTIMLSADENAASLQRASQGAGIVVAEGMMGLFDGLSGGSDLGSSADIARTLRLPVVLVMDASSCSRSIAATLLGFTSFNKSVKIAAVILNRVSGEAHFQMLLEAIQGTVNAPVLGWIPRNSAWTIPERHLGLHDANERAWTEAELASLAEVVEKHLDLDRFLELATAEDAPVTATDAVVETVPRLGPAVRIAVARDAAFSFYYEDNFDLLKDCGAELVEFSPLCDRRLPERVDALYIGGGYPELHAGELRDNRAMIAEVQEFCQSGRPVYAECGGMMFLAKDIVADGTTYPMAGVLPLSIEMSPRLVKFGYVRVRFNSDCILGPAGTVATGHSFHYSKIQSVGEIDKAYALEYIRAGRFEQEGYVAGNVLASYVHLHFRTNRTLAGSFIHAALLARGRGEQNS
jgi:cobyrinic acid a,c-diamide synthase